MSNFQLPKQKIENENQELDEDTEIKLYLKKYLYHQMFQKLANVR